VHPPPPGGRWGWGVFFCCQRSTPSPLTVPKGQHTWVTVVKPEKNPDRFSHSGYPLGGIPARKKVRGWRITGFFYGGGRGDPWQKKGGRGSPPQAQTRWGVGWFARSGRTTQRVLRRELSSGKRWGSAPSGTLDGGMAFPREEGGGGVTGFFWVAGGPHLCLKKMREVGDHRTGSGSITPCPFRAIGHTPPSPCPIHIPYHIPLQTIPVP
jgi:hypothetical protein